MNRKFDYTIFPENSREVFFNTCKEIAMKFPYAKVKRLDDVDGTCICMFSIGEEEIVVYDDYDVGSVYIKSDVDLSNFIVDYWKKKTT